jgi:tetratricopeptide (TPR) repeat protein
LNLSLAHYQAGKFGDSIAAAQAAVALKPDYAEAYNNIAASYSALKQWDKAIGAAQTAIALKPDFQLARNNLAWALEQKRLGAR